MVEAITKPEEISLDDLWKSVSIDNGVFQPELLTNLPSLARRYLEKAIAPGTQLASAVRLWMHGEIKLGQKWHPFQAEEVICWDRGMIWQATTEMHGLPILGCDRVVDGVGNASWNTIQRSGEDITRSCVGRVQAESVWLPSVLCRPDISWAELSVSQVQATFTALGEPGKITLTVSNQGVLEQIKVDRWGSLEGEAFHYSDFGGIVEDSGTFDGYTIPARLRIGWFFGSEPFESEGESFHCTIDKAIYK
ncbi:DUF6544 family protein [Brunnivagina elsteri]|uniref:Uncharacterized protein n=1 Tax=Brunnivagina elsteri CCALA 953 TaxID=987040 RepID=A0A2A2TD26_9CYAN|nr:DUF6544 family protein [Calothrix elsteri]PAX51632.1 hypothetical protein CK510_23745 [Calothrix elsteri CCALA 953]